MATVLKIGPADHGRAMTLEEFDESGFEEGYKYELIDGKLYVSPQPNFPADYLAEWLNDKLRDYRDARPEVINYVSSKARVFVPGRRGETVPEPDLAVYHDLPRATWEEINWREVNPVLVAEILSEDDPAKDLVRNVALYWRVRAIKEYWVVDGRKKGSGLRLLVHRRSGKRWKKLALAYGDTYTTRLLPGFVLTIDPRS